MMKRYKIKSIEQTCSACPSQWEGKFEDGENLYIRYRYGYLSIRKGKSDSVLDMDEILGVQIGDGFDGLISLEAIIEISKKAIDWSLVKR